MSELSPAAQALRDAAANAYFDWDDGGPAADMAAAVLRAAAEIVAPVSYEDIYTDGRMLQYERENPVRERLLAIADELETS